MTIKELYENALEHGYEDFKLRVEVNEEYEYCDCFDVDEKYKEIILY